MPETLHSSRIALLDFVFDEFGASQPRHALAQTGSGKSPASLRRVPAILGSGEAPLANEAEQGALAKSKGGAWRGCRGAGPA